MYVSHYSGHRFNAQRLETLPPNFALYFTAEHNGRWSVFAVTGTSDHACTGAAE